MPVELLDNVTSNGDDVFSQTVAPAGHVSVWAVKNGPPNHGFRSADQLMQNGLPFGHGDRHTVKGFKTAMVHRDGQKPRENVVKGPMGVEYVELYVDEESMKQKQLFEGKVSEAQIASAKGAAVNGSSKVANDPDQDGITQNAVGMMTDEQRQLIEDKQLADLAAQAP